MFELGAVVDVTLQLRLPSEHPVITEDYLSAEVAIAGHTFTLEQHTPLRPVGERLFMADYSVDADLEPVDED